MKPFLSSIGILFWGWFTIGLLLMLFYHVPSFLQFSNGLFLVFYAIYAASLLLQAEKTKHGITAMPGRQVWLLAILVGSLTYMVEMFGTETGLLFGSYTYSDTLRFWPGGVPAAIGFAWIGVMFNAILLAKARNRVLRALEVGWYAMLFDLVLDPVAYARGFWLWEHTAEGFQLYGVPAQNFAGWFIIAAFVSFLFPSLSARTVGSKPARLYQGMLVMFGLLGLKAELWAVFIIAAAVAAGLEWRLRYDRSIKSQLV